MEILVVLCVIASIHCLIYFFDQFFKSCAHYPYIQFLKGTGFQISFLRIKWSTYALNRSFTRWGCAYNRFYDRWFSIGRNISLLMVPISLFLLIYSIFQNHLPWQLSTNTTIPTRNNLKIEAVLPGVNLPANDLSYYIFTLILCSIIHELGHALAAAREDINVVNVGVNVYFILPIAYVHLPTHKLASLTPWRTLNILCAGIWHNIVLTAIAYVLYASVPHVYSMVFHINEGMYVKDIASDSPLLGEKGIHVGDVISSINHCKVDSINDYYRCLIGNQMKAHLGYCLEQDVLGSIQSDVQTLNNDCCHGDIVPGYLCFRYDENKSACLPVRIILTAATMTCTHQSNCTSAISLHPHCLTPTSLTPPTRLFKITLSNADKAPIIYIGLPHDLHHTLTISHYTPKHPLAALLVPDQLTRTLQYVAMISFGLAIVNSLPCLHMDGQYILGSVLRLITSGKWTLERVQRVTVIACFIGTVVLVCHSGWSLYTTIFIS